MTRKIIRKKDEPSSKRAGRTIGKTMKRSEEYGREAGRYVGKKGKRVFHGLEKMGEKASKKLVGRGRGRGWHDEPFRHGLARHGIKTASGKAKGIDEVEAEYDGRPDALDEKIEELITEEGYDNYDVFEWLKHHNLIDEAEYTEFWEVLVRENPMLTGETLRYYIEETDKGDEFLKNHWEALHEIPYGGAGRAPYWLENVRGKGGDLVPLEDGDIVVHSLSRSMPDFGTIRMGSELNDRWNTNVFKDKEYKFVGTSRGAAETEIQANNGDLEYFYIGSNHFSAWKPKED